ncbi:MAG: hypothetical protein EOS63_05630 [Mesorhizobium sp.]|uniref:hypothetical protein n=1 Tax=Mesorhizobium sp. TaxID=1871066 RepID=UPI000FE76BFB|nr:hypothetical protein [Mesorhizobium sp.]RWE83168.1 MAG: hypothetical protein EOS63_05630 [Mesorhizobium sp.]TJW58706.1 MAG: hypothetical protein E5V97_31105 [Mesorhizobium sp.]
MDIRAARSRLVHETRSRLGDVITIRAKLRGEMSVADDPFRPAMVDLKGRFDINPDLEFLGGHDRGLAPIRFAGRLCTISIPRADMAWLPKAGDQCEVTSQSAEPIYAIERVVDDAAEAIVFYLSALGR